MEEKEILDVRSGLKIAIYFIFFKRGTYCRNVSHFILFHFIESPLVRVRPIIRLVVLEHKLSAE